MENKEMAVRLTLGCIKIGVLHSVLEVRETLYLFLEIIEYDHSFTIQKIDKSKNKK